jgi:hypothetical protein
MANDLEYLNRQFRTDEWLTPPAQRENVFVWRFAPETAIKGLEPLRVQRVEAPPEVTDVLGGAEASITRATQHSPLRITDSVFAPGGGDEGQLITLRTIECDSRAAARAQLLQVLAEFQGPIVERTDVAGEVSFAAPGYTTIAGVRGNLVFILRNGGSDLVDLSRIATELDQRLSAESPAESSRVKPDDFRFDDDPESSFHVIASGGEVVVENQRPVFRADDRGEHEVVVIRNR